jgi:hypothetical protein
VALLVAYFLANLGLAVWAFYVATSRPGQARWVWFAAALFVLGGAGMVYDLATNARLYAILMRF